MDTFLCWLGKFEHYTKSNRWQNIKLEAVMFVVTRRGLLEVEILENVFLFIFFCLVINNAWKINYI